MTGIIAYFLTVSLVLQVAKCCNPRRLTEEDRRKLRENEIVPKITEEYPEYRAVIQYGQTIYTTLGNEITPTKAHTKPEVSWPSQEGTLYTLIMQGPGFPEITGIQQFIHWGVVNIPNNNIQGGNTSLEYFGPAPIENTGFSSYTFLIYQQGKQFEEEDLGGVEDNAKFRTQFSVKQITAALNLSGNPVAGNFFRVTADENSNGYLEAIKEKYNLSF